ncbi:MAG: succinate dehydrogenase, cytochrome b556 subunit [Burkholderiaceae bacterium]|jgi:succinate dehydrogenase / fumarate reductase cytochrome b subunit
MSELPRKSRPQFRNIHVSQILAYRLPIAGVMSILHRISGAAMFLSLPIIVWLFDLSLTSELSYATLMEVTDSVLVKLILCGLAWAFIHHFFGGVRHLISDMHIGITKESSPRIASVFMGLSLVVSLLAWLSIFGVL